MPAAVRSGAALDGDAGVVARDPALAGLATLLDDAAFCAALAAALPDRGIRRATSAYLRYKPATSCLATFRVEHDAGETLVSARAQTAAALDKLEKNVRRADADGPLGPALVLPGAPIAVFPFPNDRSLRALPAMADPRRRARLLARKLPDRPALHDADLRVLRFKPERRFVAQLVGRDDERATLRVYAREFERAARAAASLARCGPRVPRRLAVSKRRHAIVLEWLDGETVSSGLMRGLPEHAAAAGAAVARLHAAGVADLPPPRRDGDRLAFARAARTVARLVPEAGAAARAVGRAVAPDLDARRPAMAVHGDFSADQVLLTDDGPALLDLDEAGIGQPVGDLASFLASLEADVIAGGVARGTADAARTALLDGYADAGGVCPDPGVLARWTAAALVRRAPEPFRHREALWPDRVEAIVGRAESLLSDA